MSESHNDKIAAGLRDAALATRIAGEALRNFPEGTVTRDRFNEVIAAIAPHVSTRTGRVLTRQRQSDPDIPMVREVRTTPDPPEFIEPRKRRPEAVPGEIRLNPLTDEEIEYIRDLDQKARDYDPTTIIGGSRQPEASGEDVERAIKDFADKNWAGFAGPTHCQEAAQALAAAAQRAGAEAMRERAAKQCNLIAVGYLSERRADRERGKDMASVAAHCASSIRALPTDTDASDP